MRVSNYTSIKTFYVYTDVRVHESFSLATVPSGNILVSRKFAIELAKTHRWHRH